MTDLKRLAATMAGDPDCPAHYARSVAEAAAAVDRTGGRWYCVSTKGFATLCKNAGDARASAKLFDLDWPSQAPHAAMMLGDVTALRAEVEALRADNARLTALLGSRPLGLVIV